MRADVESMFWRPHALLVFFLALQLCYTAEVPLASRYPNVSIGKLAISPDATQIVFTRRGALPLGGHLYLLDLKTRKVQRLTGRSAFTKGEVYADPDFSPDGTSIVFAIHAKPSGPRSNATGPLATMDIRARKIGILDSTRNFGGLDAVYLEHPRWSPDGTRILFDAEGTFVIADATGKSKKEMTEAAAATPNDERAVSSRGWLGPGCVLFVYDSPGAAVQFLNLATGEKSPADNIPPPPASCMRHPAF